jgi:hypothetical protein
MFKAISWGQYASVVLLLLLLYYAYVGLAYYRAELLGLFSGKGKVVGPTLVTTPQRSPNGRGSLIAKAASALPALPPEAVEPAAPLPTNNEKMHADEQGIGEESQAETAHHDEQLAPIFELPAIDLASVEAKGISNYDIISEKNIINENLTNFTEHDDGISFQVIESELESASDDFEVGATIGIAQLGHYLGRAAEGQISQAQLAEQEPALANTELLLAFFQNSTKNAQRATAHLYEGVTEPVLD